MPKRRIYDETGFIEYPIKGHFLDNTIHESENYTQEFSPSILKMWEEQRKNRLKEPKSSSGPFQYLDIAYDTVNNKPINVLSTFDPKSIIGPDNRPNPAAIPNAYVADKPFQTENPMMERTVWWKKYEELRKLQNPYLYDNGTGRDNSSNPMNYYSEITKYMQDNGITNKKDFDEKAPSELKDKLRLLESISEKNANTDLDKSGEYISPIWRQRQLEVEFHKRKEAFTNTMGAEDRKASGKYEEEDVSKAMSDILSKYNLVENINGKIAIKDKQTINQAIDELEAFRFNKRMEYLGRDHRATKEDASMLRGAQGEFNTAWDYLKPFTSTATRMAARGAAFLQESLSVWGSKQDALDAIDKKITSLENLRKGKEDKGITEYTKEQLSAYNETDLADVAGAGARGFGKGIIDNPAAVISPLLAKYPALMMKYKGLSVAAAGLQYGMGVAEDFMGDRTMGERLLGTNKNDFYSSIIENLPQEQKKDLPKISAMGMVASATESIAALLPAFRTVASIDDARKKYMYITGKAKELEAHKDFAEIWKSSKGVGSKLGQTLTNGLGIAKEQALHFFLAEMLSKRGDMTADEIVHSMQTGAFMGVTGAALNELFGSIAVNIGKSRMAEKIAEKIASNPGLKEALDKGESVLPQFTKYLESTFKATPLTREQIVERAGQGMKTATMPVSTALGNVIQGKAMHIARTGRYEYDDNPDAENYVDLGLFKLHQQWLSDVVTGAMLGIPKKGMNEVRKETGIGGDFFVKDNEERADTYINKHFEALKFIGENHVKLSESLNELKTQQKSEAAAASKGVDDAVKANKKAKAQKQQPQDQQTPQAGQPQAGEAAPAAPLGPNALLNSILDKSKSVDGRTLREGLAEELPIILKIKEAFRKVWESKIAEDGGDNLFRVPLQGMDPTETFKRDEEIGKIFEIEGDKELDDIHPALRDLFMELGNGDFDAGRAIFAETIVKFHAHTAPTLLDEMESATEGAVSTSRGMKPFIEGKEQEFFSDIYTWMAQDVADMKDMPNSSLFQKGNIYEYIPVDILNLKPEELPQQPGSHLDADAAKRTSMNPNTVDVAETPLGVDPPEQAEQPAAEPATPVITPKERLAKVMESLSPDGIKRGGSRPIFTEEDFGNDKATLSMQEKQTIDNMLQGDFNAKTEFTPDEFVKFLGLGENRTHTNVIRGLFSLLPAGTTFMVAHSNAPSEHSAVHIKGDNGSTIVIPSNRAGEDSQTLTILHEVLHGIFSNSEVLKPEARKKMNDDLMDVIEQLEVWVQEQEKSGANEASQIDKLATESQGLTNKDDSLARVKWLLEEGLVNNGELIPEELITYLFTEPYFANALSNIYVTAGKVAPLRKKGAAAKTIDAFRRVKEIIKTTLIESLLPSGIKKGGEEVISVHEKISRIVDHALAYDPSTKPKEVVEKPVRKVKAKREVKGKVGEATSEKVTSEKEPERIVTPPNINKEKEVVPPPADFNEGEDNISSLDDAFSGELRKVVDQNKGGNPNNALEGEKLFEDIMVSFKEKARKDRAFDDAARIVVTTIYQDWMANTTGMKAVFHLSDAVNESIKKAIEKAGVQYVDSSKASKEYDDYWRGVYDTHKDSEGNNTYSFEYKDQNLKPDEEQPLPSRRANYDELTTGQKTKMVDDHWDNVILTSSTPDEQEKIGQIEDNYSSAMELEKIGNAMRADKARAAEQPVEDRALPILHFLIGKAVPYDQFHEMGHALLDIAMNTDSPELDEFYTTVREAVNVVNDIIKNNPLINKKYESIVERGKSKYGEEMAKKMAVNEIMQLLAEHAIKAERTGFVFADAWGDNAHMRSMIKLGVDKSRDVFKGLRNFLFNKIGIDPTYAELVNLEKQLGNVKLFRLLNDHIKMKNLFSQASTLSTKANPRFKDIAVENEVQYQQELSTFFGDTVSGLDYQDVEDGKDIGWVDKMRLFLSKDREGLDQVRTIFNHLMKVSGYNFDFVNDEDVTDKFANPDGAFHNLEDFKYFLSNSKPLIRNFSAEDVSRLAEKIHIRYKGLEERKSIHITDLGQLKIKKVEGNGSIGGIEQGVREKRRELSRYADEQVGAKLFFKNIGLPVERLRNIGVQVSEATKVFLEFAKNVVPYTIEGYLGYGENGMPEVSYKMSDKAFINNPNLHTDMLSRGWLISNSGDKKMLGLDVTPIFNEFVKNGIMELTSDGIYTFADMNLFDARLQEQFEESEKASDLPASERETRRKEFMAEKRDAAFAKFIANKAVALDAIHNMVYDLEKYWLFSHAGGGLRPEQFMVDAEIATEKGTSKGKFNLLDLGYLYDSGNGYKFEFKNGIKVDGAEPLIAELEKVYTDFNEFKTSPYSYVLEVDDMITARKVSSSSGKQVDITEKRIASLKEIVSQPERYKLNANGVSELNLALMKYFADAFDAYQSIYIDASAKDFPAVSVKYDDKGNAVVKEGKTSLKYASSVWRTGVTIAKNYIDQFVDIRKLKSVPGGLANHGIVEKDGNYHAKAFVFSADDWKAVSPELAEIFSGIDGGVMALNDVAHTFISAIGARPKGSQKTAGHFVNANGSIEFKQATHVLNMDTQPDTPGGMALYSLVKSLQKAGYSHIVVPEALKGDGNYPGMKGNLVEVSIQGEKKNVVIGNKGEYFEEVDGDKRKYAGGNWFAPESMDNLEAEIISASNKGLATIHIPLTGEGGLQWVAQKGDVSSYSAGAPFRLPFYSPKSPLLMKGDGKSAYENIVYWVTKRGESLNEFTRGYSGLLNYLSGGLGDNGKRKINKAPIDAALKRVHQHLIEKEQFFNNGSFDDALPLNKEEWWTLQALNSAVGKDGNIDLDSLGRILMMSNSLVNDAASYGVLSSGYKLGLGSVFYDMIKKEYSYYRALRSEEGHGSMPVLVPNLDAGGDVKRALSYVESNEIGIVEGFDPSTEVDQKTGLYKGYGQGLSLSLDVIQRLGLKIGEKVFINITPTQAEDSFVPMVLTGVLPKGNKYNMTFNKDLALGILGKDHDIDTISLFKSGDNWIEKTKDNKGNEVIRDHFNELHETLTANGVNKGIIAGTYGKRVFNKIKEAAGKLPWRKVQLDDEKSERLFKGMRNKPAVWEHPFNNPENASNPLMFEALKGVIPDDEIAPALQSIFFERELQGLPSSPMLSGNYSLTARQFYPNKKIDMTAYMGDMFGLAVQSNKIQPNWHKVFNLFSYVKEGSVDTYSKFPFEILADEWLNQMTDYIPPETPKKNDPLPPNRIAKAVRRAVDVRKLKDESKKAAAYLMSRFGGDEEAGSYANVDDIIKHNIFPVNGNLRSELSRNHVLQQIMSDPNYISELYRTSRTPHLEDTPFDLRNFHDSYSRILEYSNKIFSSQNFGYRQFLQRKDEIERHLMLDKNNLAVNSVTGKIQNYLSDEAKAKAHNMALDEFNSNREQFILDATHFDYYSRRVTPNRDFIQEIGDRGSKFSGEYDLGRAISSSILKALLQTGTRAEGLIYRKDAYGSFVHNENNPLWLNLPEEGSYLSGGRIKGESAKGKRARDIENRGGVDAKTAKDFASKIVFPTVNEKKEKTRLGVMGDAEYSVDPNSPYVKIGVYHSPGGLKLRIVSNHGYIIEKMNVQRLAEKKRAESKGKDGKFIFNEGDDGLATLDMPIDTVTEEGYINNIARAIYESKVEIGKHLRNKYKEDHYSSFYDGIEAVYGLGENSMDRLFTVTQGLMFTDDGMPVISNLPHGEEDKKAFFSLLTYGMMKGYTIQAKAFMDKAGLSEADKMQTMKDIHNFFAYMPNTSDHTFSQKIADLRDVRSTLSDRIVPYDMVDRIGIDTYAQILSNQYYLIAGYYDNLSPKRQKEILANYDTDQESVARKLGFSDAADMESKIGGYIQQVVNKVESKRIADEKEGKDPKVKADPLTILALGTPTSTPTEITRVLEGYADGISDILISSVKRDSDYSSATTQEYTLSNEPPQVFRNSEKQGSFPYKSMGVPFIYTPIGRDVFRTLSQNTPKIKTSDGEVVDLIGDAISRSFELADTGFKAFEKKGGFNNLLHYQDAEEGLFSFNSLGMPVIRNYTEAPSTMKIMRDKISEGLVGGLMSRYEKYATGTNQYMFEEEIGKFAGADSNILINPSEENKNTFIKFLKDVQEDGLAQLASEDAQAAYKKLTDDLLSKFAPMISEQVDFFSGISNKDMFYDMARKDYAESLYRMYYTFKSEVRRENDRDKVRGYDPNNRWDRIKLWGMANVGVMRGIHRNDMRTFLDRFSEQYVTNLDTDIMDVDFHRSLSIIDIPDAELPRTEDGSIDFDAYSEMIFEKAVATGVAKPLTAGALVGNNLHLSRKYGSTIGGNVVRVPISRMIFEMHANTQYHIQRIEQEMNVHLDNYNSILESIDASRHGEVFKNMQLLSRNITKLFPGLRIVGKQMGEDNVQSVIFYTRDSVNAAGKVKKNKDSEVFQGNLTEGYDARRGGFDALVEAMAKDLSSGDKDLADMQITKDTLRLYLAGQIINHQMHTYMMPMIQRINFIKGVLYKKGLFSSAQQMHNLSSNLFKVYMRGRASNDNIDVRQQALSYLPQVRGKSQLIDDMRKLLYQTGKTVEGKDIAVEDIEEYLKLKADTIPDEDDATMLGKAFVVPSMTQYTMPEHAIERAIDSSDPGYGLFTFGVPYTKSAYLDYYTSFTKSYGHGVASALEDIAHTIRAKENPFVQENLYWHLSNAKGEEYVYDNIIAKEDIPKALEENPNAPVWVSYEDEGISNKIAYNEQQKDNDKKFRGNHNFPLHRGMEVVKTKGFLLGSDNNNIYLLSPASHNIITVDRSKIKDMGIGRSLNVLVRKNHEEIVRSLNTLDLDSIINDIKERDSAKSDLNDLKQSLFLKYKANSEIGYALKNVLKNKVFTKQERDQIAALSIELQNNESKVKSYVTKFYNAIDQNSMEAYKVRALRLSNDMAISLGYLQMGKAFLASSQMLGGVALTAFNPFVGAGIFAAGFGNAFEWAGSVGTRILGNYTSSGRFAWSHLGFKGVITGFSSYFENKISSDQLKRNTTSRISTFMEAEQIIGKTDAEHKGLQKRIKDLSSINSALEDVEGLNDEIRRMNNEIAHFANEDEYSLADNLVAKSEKIVSLTDKYFDDKGYDEKQKRYLQAIMSRFDHDAAAKEFIDENGETIIMLRNARKSFWDKVKDFLTIKGAIARSEFAGKRLADYFSMEVLESLHLAGPGSNMDPHDVNILKERLSTLAIGEYGVLSKLAVEASPAGRFLGMYAKFQRPQSSWYLNEGWANIGIDKYIREISAKNGFDPDSRIISYKDDSILSTGSMKYYEDARKKLMFGMSLGMISLAIQNTLSFLLSDDEEKSLLSIAGDKSKEYVREFRANSGVDNPASRITEMIGWLAWNSLMIGSIRSMNHDIEEQIFVDEDANPNTFITYWKNAQDSPADFIMGAGYGAGASALIKFPSLLAWNLVNYYGRTAGRSNDSKFDKALDKGQDLVAGNIVDAFAASAMGLQPLYELTVPFATSVTEGYAQQAKKTKRKKSADVDNRKKNIGRTFPITPKSND